jgi:hypothetical protein
MHRMMSGLLTATVVVVFVALQIACVAAGPRSARPG